jgi:ankyrin repeat protein
VTLFEHLRQSLVPSILAAAVLCKFKVFNCVAWSFCSVCMAAYAVCLCVPVCAGADQASRTASGATGLHIAANSGSADIIADLLESSEDLDPDDDGAYNCESHSVAPGYGSAQPVQ